MPDVFEASQAAWFYVTTPNQPHHIYPFSREEQARVTEQKKRPSHKGCFQVPLRRVRAGAKRSSQARAPSKIRWLIRITILCIPFGSRLAFLLLVSQSNVIVISDIWLSSVHRDRTLQKWLQCGWPVHSGQSTEVPEHYGSANSIELSNPCISSPSWW